MIWLDILPMEIQNLIYQFVFKDTVKTLNLFTNYKKMCQVIIKKSRNMDILKNIEFSSKEEVFLKQNGVDYNLHCLQYIDKHNVTHIISPLARYFNLNFNFNPANGETCGVFDSRIINNINKVFRLVNYIDNYNYLGYRDIAKATKFTYKLEELDKIFSNEKKYKKIIDYCDKFSSPAYFTRSKIKAVV